MHDTTRNTQRTHLTQRTPHAARSTQHNAHNARDTHTAQEARFRYSFSKLHIFNQTEYARLVYIDADAFVLADVAGLAHVLTVWQFVAEGGLTRGIVPRRAPRKDRL